MKSSIKCSALALTLLAFAGCAPLVQIAQDVQKATAPAMLSVPLPQICQEAKDNKVRANSLYENKGLTATGEVRLVSEGFQPRYSVLIRSGQVSLHAGTANKLSVTQLSVGKTVRVSGVVTDVDYDFQGCRIALKDATF